MSDELAALREELVSGQIQLDPNRRRDCTPERGDEEPSDFGLLLEIGSARLVRGSYVLDAPEYVPAVWGEGHQVLIARGEPTLLVGPDGVGKTTIAQQLALAIAGIREPTLLGFPVQPGRRVLYLACDRPEQARRSMRRMVSEKDRELLDECLVIRRGPLPFDLAKQPDGLVALADQAESDFVVIDCLKDVAMGLASDETGQGLTAAFQRASAEDIDLLVLHHQRKQQQRAGKPRHLSDVYGSRWITSGCGSVLMLWGEAGDLVVELTHLKQPDEVVGPLKIIHDHVAGVSSLEEHVDAFMIVVQSSAGVTVGEVALALYGNDDKNEVEKARRQLERLRSEGRIHRAGGGRGRSKAARYFPIESGHDQALS